MEVMIDSQTNNTANDFFSLLFKFINYFDELDFEEIKNNPEFNIVNHPWFLNELKNKERFEFYSQLNSKLKELNNIIGKYETIVSERKLYECLNKIKKN